MTAIMIFPLAATSAPTLEVEQALDFGILALRGNTTPSSLRVSATGNALGSGEMIPVGDAVAGEYRLSGFPSGIKLVISIDDGLLSEGGFGVPEFFQATAFEHPEEVFSDNNGQATFKLGGRLNNSANGNLYTDAPYTGDTQLHVQYWSQEAGGYLTFSETLSLTAQAQSTLTLDEVQPLSFGNLSARTHPSDTASLTLKPSGSLEKGVASQATLITLDGAQPGQIRVSGAAPNVSLSITPQAGSVLMRHTNPNLDGPRFIVRDFTTLPANTGRSDTKGELTIMVGATLQTEADPRPYAEGEYRGTYELAVSY